jgi:hypothetical protein
VHACDNTIGLEYKEVSVIAGFHNGAIITGTVDDFFSERKTRQKPAEQPVFANVTQFHCPFQRQRRYVSSSLGRCSRNLIAQ